MQHVRANWRFTTQEARIKLKRLYPILLRDEIETVGPASHARHLDRPARLHGWTRCQLSRQAYLLSLAATSTTADIDEDDVGNEMG
ncbi:MAG TPA: hypothetical protein VFV38_12955 [Ktedonobacteraceae bacterium]|nr:hypothetical protein [Ktedonobacteraceae bacterium]